MTGARHSIPLLLAGVSVLAIGLAASPIAIDSNPIGVGNQAAFAQGGGGGGQTQSSADPLVDAVREMKMDRETVRSVQRQLNQLGYRAGPEDGIIGPRTRRAISAYQSRMGMEPNGMLTPDLVEGMMAGGQRAN